MKILINEKLSENRYKTPEGYLVCRDAILARTGKQTYTRDEVFNDGNSDEVEIDRPSKEVFADATLASFENKPITVEHPDEDVNSSNWKDYTVGFVRDVRKGEVDGQEVMLGNLVIVDAKAIEEIENGEHTDLSCGYDCDIVDEENPIQKNIRGNHVALCAQGRAGNARIIDTAINKEMNEEMELQEMDDCDMKDELFHVREYKGYIIEDQEIHRIFVKKNGKILKEFKTEYDAKRAIDKNILDSSKEKDAIEDANSFEYKGILIIKTPYGWKFKLNGKTYEVATDEEVKEEIDESVKDSDMKDASHVYEIRWMDLAAKSKGWADYKHNDKIKAGTLREALEKLANTAGFGVGTTNMLIINIHRDGASYQYTDKLSNLLKKDLKDEEAEDSLIRDKATFIISYEDEDGDLDEDTIEAHSRDEAIRIFKRKHPRCEIIKATYFTDAVGRQQKDEKVKDGKQLPNTAELTKIERLLSDAGLLIVQIKYGSTSYAYNLKPKGSIFTEYKESDVRAYQSKLANIKNEIENTYGYPVTYNVELISGRLDITFAVNAKNTKDAVEDALVAPGSDIQSNFEKLLVSKNFKIVSKRQNYLSGYHYQVEIPGKGYDKNALRKKADDLNNVSKKVESQGYPMTYNVGLGEDGSITAGVDIYGKSMRDSVKDAVFTSGKAPASAHIEPEFSALNNSELNQLNSLFSKYKFTVVSRKKGFYGAYQYKLKADEKGKEAYDKSFHRKKIADIVKISKIVESWGYRVQHDCFIDYNGIVTAEMTVQGKRAKDSAKDATNNKEWELVCKTFCKKIGAELLFVNDYSFGYEDKYGNLIHMRADELERYLQKNKLR